MSRSRETSKTTTLDSSCDIISSIPSIPIYERLSKMKIGHQRGQLRRTRSKSLDEFPEIMIPIDPIASAKISKQFEHLQDAYKANPSPILMTSTIGTTGGIRRRSVIRQSSNDDINVGKSSNNNTTTPQRPRSTLRPTILDPMAARPQTQPAPQARSLQRGYSKDDHDIPTEKRIPHPPLQPTPPSRPNPPRTIKRGMSKDDYDIPSSLPSTTRSPRKQWVKTTNNPTSSPLMLEPPSPPSLILERPKLFWRQRLSSLFYVYLHTLPSSSETLPSSLSTFLPDLFRSSYFEIIPIDVTSKYSFSSLYVSLFTLLQMKLKEFSAVEESRPRSLTSRPYASREEVAEVSRMKQEIKTKMMIEIAAEYCVDNMDIVPEESNEENIALILKRYHEQTQSVVVMNIPKPESLVPVDPFSLPSLKKIPSVPFATPAPPPTPAISPTSSLSLT